MTDPRKLDAEAAALIDAPMSLRERLAMYAKMFAAGLAAIVAFGVVAGLIAPSSVPVAIGYTAVFAGTIMLLAGGASGGGYANLGFGMVDRLVDAARRDGGVELDETADRSSRKFGVSGTRRHRDPMERLRKGLRPEKNPSAFWTVVGGFLYIAFGAAMVLV